MLNNANPTALAAATAAGAGTNSVGSKAAFEGLPALNSPTMSERTASPWQAPIPASSFVQMPNGSTVPLPQFMLARQMPSNRPASTLIFVPSAPAFSTLHPALQAAPHPPSYPPALTVKVTPPPAPAAAAAAAASASVSAPAALDLVTAAQGLVTATSTAVLGSGRVSRTREPSPTASGRNRKRDRASTADRHLRLAGNPGDWVEAHWGNNGQHGKLVRLHVPESEQQILFDKLTALHPGCTFKIVGSFRFNERQGRKLVRVTPNGEEAELRLVGERRHCPCDRHFSINVNHIAVLPWEVKPRTAAAGEGGVNAASSGAAAAVFSLDEVSILSRAAAAYAPWNNELVRKVDRIARLLADPKGPLANLKITEMKDEDEQDAPGSDCANTTDEEDDDPEGTVDSSDAEDSYREYDSDDEHPNAAISPDGKKRLRTN